MSYIKQFSNSLKTKISEEDLKDEIVKEFKAAKEGSTHKLSLIKLIHEMYKEADRGPFRLPESRGEGARIEDVNYEEIDPPMIT